MKESETDKGTKRIFDPESSDYVIRFFRRLISKNPVVLTIAYSLLCVGITVLLAFLTDLIAGKNIIDSLLTDYANLINFGIIMPIGILLVLNFYSKLREGFYSLVEDQAVVFKDEEARTSFFRDLHRSLNRRWFFPVSLGFSLVTNTIIMLRLKDTWHAPGTGVHAWWFRLFVVFNFYMIANILLKGTAAVLEMRRLFGMKNHKVVLQPLHPDGCGGLRPLGSISMAINYFVCLIAVYLSVLAFVRSASLTSRTIDFPLFIPMVIGFAILAVFLFFVPLSRAHEIMRNEKDTSLHVLSMEFQKTYHRVAKNLAEVGIPLEDAQKIASIERLYRIASRMPVWPIDIRIIVQFIAVVATPLAIGIASEVIAYIVTLT
jgi:hypothetical protein